MTPCECDEYGDGGDTITLADLASGKPFPPATTEYEVAYLAGLRSYAWHRDDGELMVGSERTPTTYEAAKARFLAGRRCTCGEYGGQESCGVHGKLATHNVA